VKINLVNPLTALDVYVRPKTIAVKISKICRCVFDRGENLL